MNKYAMRRLGVVDGNARARPTLSECLDVVLTQTPALLEDLFTSLTALVQPTGEVKSSSAEFGLHGHADIIKSGVFLLSQRPQFEAAFEQNLRTVVMQGGSGTQSAGASVRYDDFVMLEDEQIDRSIERAMIEQLVVSAVQERLPAINTLISSLMGWTSMQWSLNPLKPENYAYALDSALHAVLTTTQHRNGIAVQMATYLGRALGQFYRELAEWLRSLGVEPVEIINKAERDLKAQPTKAQRTLLTMEKLRTLLTQEINLFPSVQDFSHTIPLSLEALEEMKMVDVLVKRLSNRAQTSQPTQPASVGLAIPARIDKAGRVLGKQLGHEVVRLMMDNLQDDQRIPVQVRMSLKELEPCLNKLADKDQRFFSDKHHPARLFLERITHRSLAYRQASDEGFVQFQQSLTSAVQLLQRGEPDAAEFARQLHALEQGWYEAEASTRRKVEYESKQLVIQEQRELLADKWAAEFVISIGTRPVPEFVGKFLLGVWSYVMAEAELQGDEGSNTLSDYAELVRRLIWSSQVDKIRKHPGRLMRMVPQMLMTLRKGLLSIQYPEKDSQQFLDDLVSVHEHAFDIVRSAAERTQPAKLEPEIEIPESVPDGVHMDIPVLGIDQVVDKAGLASAWASAMAEGKGTSDYVAPTEDTAHVADKAMFLSDWTADQLTLGAWIDLAWHGQWVRAKLSWTSPHRTLFMFVSTAGFSHSMSLRTMTRLRNSGLLHLISDGQVMDGALNAVARAALDNDVRQAQRQR